MEYIPHQGLIFTEPKTRASNRTFKVGSNCLDMLKEYQLYQRGQRMKIGTAWASTVQIENGKAVQNDLLFTRWDGSPLDLNKVTTWFPKFMREHDLPAVTVHSLRHPYVKHTTKKYNSEKQKTQATKIDLIAWVFRFCIFNYSKRSWTL